MTLLSQGRKLVAFLRRPRREACMPGARIVSSYCMRLLQKLHDRRLGDRSASRLFTQMPRYQR